MAQEDRQSATPALDRAQTFLTEGRRDDARQVLEGLVGGGWPERADPLLVFRAAQIFVELGDVERALGLARARLQLPPVSFDLHLLAGRLSVRMAMLEPAERLTHLRAAEGHLRTVIEAFPSDAKANAILGLVLDRQGRLHEAIEAWRCAFVLDPANVDHRVGLAIALSTAGRHREAIPHFERVVAERPRQSEAQVNLGLALRESGELERAANAFRLAAALRPRSARVLVDLGITFRRMGRMEEALESYDRALELEPDLAEAFHQKGRLYLLSGRPGEASRWLAEARERAPEDREIKRTLVELARAAEHDDDDTVAAVSPLTPDLSCHLGCFPVPEIVEFLNHGRRSGILEVRVGGEQGAELELLEGCLLSGRLEDDPSFLEQAVEAGVSVPRGIAEAEMGRGAAPLFEALLEAGVDAETLAHLGYESAVRTIQILLDWSEGMAEFRSRPPPPTPTHGRIVDMSVDAQGVLLEVFRRLDEAGRERTGSSV